MLSLAKRYHPMTGEPFRQDAGYWEQPPCDALKPYIRCFWGTLHPIAPQDASATEAIPGLVIPDTCMDIIFDINYTQNHFSGTFCTLDEASYRTSSTPCPDIIATFGIRFYAWTANLFADWDFTGSKNQCFEAKPLFRQLTKVLEPVLFDIPDLFGKMQLAESVLLSMLSHRQPEANLLNAVHRLLRSNGRAKISDLTDYAAISPRKLERIFQRYMGLSPKSFASLVRYQLLWQDMATNPSFDVLDAVEKYGYTDQAHLLNDFKRRHLMNPKEALAFASKACAAK